MPRYVIYRADVEAVAQSLGIHISDEDAQTLISQSEARIENRVMKLGTELLIDEIKNFKK